MEIQQIVGERVRKGYRYSVSRKGCEVSANFLEFKFEELCLAYSPAETEMGSIRFKTLLVLAVVAIGCSLVTVKPLRGLPSVQRLRVPPLDQLPTTLVKAPMSLLAAAHGDVPAPLPASSRFQMSELVKINSLMLFFYSTLGAVMPYMPLYYRKIGISGETARFPLDYICLLVIS